MAEGSSNLNSSINAGASEGQLSEICQLNPPADGLRARHGYFVRETGPAWPPEQELRCNYLRQQSTNQEPVQELSAAEQTVISVLDEDVQPIAAPE